MPQMAPLNWTLMYIFIMFLFLFLMITHFYISTFKPKKIKFFKRTQAKYWK